MEVLDIREKRKIDHIKGTLDNYYTYKDYFEDISLVPKASSVSDFNSIDLKTKLYGKSLGAPLLINGMTGGVRGLEKYNESFAKAAKNNNIAMAVGSQKAGVLNRDLIETYAVVRKENPSGLIFANLSALEDLDTMKRAVEMIEGDALQLHVNHGQELSMVEGDRDFRKLLLNVQKAVKEIKVPIIIKEVGSGISREAAREFANIGVSNFDTGGSGGTNFSLIEEKRQGYPEQVLSTIGIPTPVSIIEVRKEIPESFIFATGGIRNSVQVVKSLVLGADIAAMAGFFLKTYNDCGEEKLSLEINRIIEEVKKIFVVLGFSKLEDAKNGKYILKNEIKEWTDQII